MKLPNFDYRAPVSVDEAVGLLAANNDARIISGGQSLVPMLAFRLAYPSMLVDLRNIANLDRIQIADDGLRVGARVRWCQIECDARLSDSHPLFQDMISHVAHYQIRNRGTVGGSLAHADPAAEMPGLAVVCDCEIIVVGSGGTRSIAAADLFTGPLDTTLEQSEVITEVRFPAWPAQRRWAFIEIARRKGDFAMAGVAIYYDLDTHGKASNAHVGVIGVTATPRRLNNVEAAIDGRTISEELIAEVKATASDSVEPMSDLHAGADYRKSLVGTLSARALRRAAGFRREAP